MPFEGLTYIKSASTTTPPVSPADGDSYIVPPGSSSPWDTHGDEQATWSDSLPTPAWVYTTPDPTFIYSVEDESDMLHAWSSQDDQLYSLGIEYTSNKTVYVGPNLGKASDDHSGNLVNEPKLTIASAMTAAAAQATGESQNVNVVVLGGGRILEDIEVPDWVNFIAPGTVSFNKITLNEGSTAVVGVVSVEDDAQVQVASGVTKCYLKADEISVPSATSSAGIECNVSGATLHLDIGRVVVQHSGTFGLGHASAGAGQVVGQIKEILLDADSTTAIKTNGLDISGLYIGRIAEEGTRTGLTAFDVDAGTVAVNVGSITGMDVLYDVESGATLAGTIAYEDGGTRDNAGTVELLLGTEAPGGFSVDTISEITSAAGVTVDGLLIKDGKAVQTFDSLSNVAFGAKITGSVPFWAGSAWGVYTPALFWASLNHSHPTGTNDSGTSFPATGTGKRFYRSDLGSWFFYDNTRSKWLAEADKCVTFSKATASTGDYLDLAGIVTSATEGMTPPWGITITAIGASWTTAGDVTFDFEQDGSSQGTTNPGSSVTEWTASNLNIDIAAATRLASKVSFTGGGSITNVLVTVFFRRHAT